MPWKNTPKAPDPVDMARAQTAQNRETAITQANLNMVDQNAPGGSLKYNQTGKWEDGTPRYSATQSLSPEQKSLYDLGNQAQQQYGQTALSQLGNVTGRLSQPFTTQGATPFNAGSYLASNPDVAAGIQSGAFKDAQQHYDLYGKNEGRTGSGEMVGSIAMGGLPALHSQAAAQQGVKYGIENAGQIQRTFADVGQTKRDFADVGGAQRSLDYSAFGDPNISRNSVQDALLARLQPSMDQDRAKLETQLANQGLMPGTQAYDDAFDVHTRQVNDSRLGAILSAGQEQSRIAGLGINQGNFLNAAQAQDFGQAQARAGFFNQGQQQDYTQAQGRAAFANQAQQQQYGQNANDASFWNQAQNQDFGQSMANANLANQARAQGVNERISTGNFANTARQNTINENIQQRQQPLNELAALLSGAQVQSPSWVTTPQTGVQGTDVMGPMMQQYQQQLQQQNAATGGLFGLAGGLGGGYLAGRNKFWGP